MPNRIHRMTEQELPAVLDLLRAFGGTARTPESWRQDKMTALLFGEPSDPITAVMPMSRRTIEVSPGRTIAAGWLSSNQFASRMSLRRKTRDTARDWPELLPELDALVVVRRDEGSLAARWYSQTGFHDVLGIRCLYLDMEAPPGGGGAIGATGPAGLNRYQVEVVSASEMIGATPAGNWDARRWQPEMLAVYRDVYGACGGAVLRDANFWSPALAHHYYRQHYQFQIVGLWSAAGKSMLMGYAVIGWSGWHSKRPRMDILELATRQWDTGVANELLLTTCQLAWSKNVHQVRAVISVHDPYRGHLARYGFADRWGYVMLAKWLRAQRYLDRVAETLPVELGGISLELTTLGGGEVPLTLRNGDGKASGVKGLRLQGDARVMTRLLLQRLDVQAATEGGGAPGGPAGAAEGALFSTDAALTPTEQTRLSLLFPWTPWIFHMLDFI